MIENKLVQKMVKHVLNPEKKKFIDKNIMHPEREWFLGLLVGILICTLGAWWSMTSYMTYSHVSIQDKESESPVVYRANMVKEVTVDFSERETVYNNLLGELKKETPVVVFVPISTSTDSDALDNNDVSSTSTNEIRSDRSTEVPYPENQVDPEFGAGEENDEVDLSN